MQGATVLGVGFPTPYLVPFIGQAERVLAMMPGAQGVVHWPAGKPNRTFMADEADLPLPEQSVQLVLVVHALEHSEKTKRMMRELWRIMTPGGRLLIAVPNRRGLWAQAEGTPFGFGQPYSTGQVIRLLREARFTPLVTQSVLYVPPSTSRLIQRVAPAWELLGKWFPGFFGGILLVEAEKQVYAIQHEPVTQPLRERILAPVTQPALT